MKFTGILLEEFEVSQRNQIIQEFLEKAIHADIIKKVTLLKKN
jgi:hypothetical protein